MCLRTAENSYTIGTGFGRILAISAVGLRAAASSAFTRCNFASRPRRRDFRSSPETFRDSSTHGEILPAPSRARSRKAFPFSEDRESDLERELCKVQSLLRMRTCRAHFSSDKIRAVNDVIKACGEFRVIAANASAFIFAFGVAALLKCAILYGFKRHFESQLRRVVSEAPVGALGSHSG